ncbi:MAG: Holliday junction branch migration protein RuvA [Defluviitaleaceae bacterium]|nr:Holliday junction branch migration protein RuvA [Defluviitaleaceae bacterium]
MINFIKGSVELVTLTTVILDNNGMGYEIICPNTAIYNEGERAKIFTQMSVTENSVTLFGFSKIEERMVFNQLLTVSGIGPKAAIALLSLGFNALVSAILNEDINTLKKAKTIGDKSAKRIVIDLKEKMASYKIDGDIKPVNLISEAMIDAVDALVSLGYSLKEVKKATENLNGTTQQIISEALRRLR